MYVDAAQAQVFKVDVETSDNGGHPPEFWARRADASAATRSDPASVDMTGLSGGGGAFRDRLRELGSRFGGPWCIHP